MWRSNSFFLSVKATVTPAQFTRFNKIYHEPFFLLSSSVESNGRTIRFDISGSTQKPYVVKLDANGGMRCNCMDAAVNCAKANCVCKHICFVAFRVVRSEQSTFFANKTLNATDVADIFTRVTADGLANDASRTSDARPPAAAAAAATVTSVEARNIGDDCPVCFDELRADQKENIRVCGECSNGAHEECIRRWIAHAPRPSCIFCRARLQR
jgi:hypothetical protein